jgi:hypothetical protein
MEPSQQVEHDASVTVNETESGDGGVGIVTVEKAVHPFASVTEIVCHLIQKQRHKWDRADKELS